MANIQVFADTAAVQQAAAAYIVASATRAINERGRFSIALSGGNTPKGLYERLAQEPLRSQINWERVHVFWGDERYVSRDDPDSSYRMAYETLLSHVPIPTAQIHPYATNLADPQQAANAYTKEVQVFIAEAIPGAIETPGATGGELITTAIPPNEQLDLILLGMGPDGHTASLFPHSTTLDAQEDVLIVVEENAPKPPPLRLSFTYALINDAREILFLVTGADKADALRAVMNETGAPGEFPAQGVKPTNGELVWLVDQAAGGAL